MARLAGVALEGGPRVFCLCPPELAIHVGDACIAEIHSVLEYGSIAQFEEGPEQPADGHRYGKVLRRATLQDQAKEGEDVVLSKMALATCKARAAKRNMPLRFVRVRYSFDRTVLTVLFTSEDNVDLRELVRELTAELRARVDMTQIGVRDEAGIIGGMGCCGRRLCCCTWLGDFSSINVKMAKTQKLSLNPAAISGNCGRLKCCLRYEYEQYRELTRGLPRQGAEVECPGGGCGYVVSTDVLQQRVKVRRKDGDGMVDYPAAEVRSATSGPGREQRSADDEDFGPERSESGPAWEA
jgi:cell fate regulator YaaT (PSP1 superfamily)